MICFDLVCCFYRKRSSAFALPTHSPTFNAMNRIPFTTLLLVVLCLAPGCDFFAKSEVVREDDPGEYTPPSEEFSLGAYYLNLDPLPPKAQLQVTIFVTRLVESNSNRNTPVTLSLLRDPPDGITVSFDPDTLSLPDGQATRESIFTISNAGAAPGRYELTVEGTNGRVSHYLAIEVYVPY